MLTVKTLEGPDGKQCDGQSFDCQATFLAFVGYLLVIV